jgi:hypothetical protein
MSSVLQSEWKINKISQACRQNFALPLRWCRLLAWRPYQITRVYQQFKSYHCKTGRRIWRRCSIFFSHNNRLQHCTIQETIYARMLLSTFDVGSGYRHQISCKQSCSPLKWVTSTRRARSEVPHILKHKNSGLHPSTRSHTDICER